MREAETERKTYSSETGNTRMDMAEHRGGEVAEMTLQK